MVIRYFYTLERDHHDKSSYHCHYTKILHNYRLYSSHGTFHTGNIYFVTGSVYILYFPHLFHLSSHPPPLWQQPVCSLCLNKFGIILKDFTGYKVLSYMYVFIYYIRQLCDLNSYSLLYILKVR